MARGSTSYTQDLLAPLEQVLHDGPAGAFEQKVTVSMSGPDMAETACHIVRRQHATWYDHPTYQRIAVAIRASMRELLRPVFVRDVPYHYLGRIADGAAYLHLPAAPRSDQAGYGLGNYDPVAAWGDEGCMMHRSHISEAAAKPRHNILDIYLDTPCSNGIAFSACTE